MKKNSFLEGAMIATFGIVLCKIIGLVYVVPFYALIGSQGGALYSYAYSIYGIFLSLSASGIPVAMSKIVSEYHALGYQYTKEKAFKIGSIIIVSLGLFSFFIMMIFAPQIAYIIIGDIEGGNTIEGVSMVIRIVSTALLVVPLLSVSKGYLQGHKFITPSSVANVLEQIIRVIVILAGSFFALKIFHLSIETTVGIAVFAATIGAITAYFYILSKIHKNQLHQKAHITREEARISTKEIFKKIIFYALPFIAIDIINSAYNMVDTLTVVKTMVDVGYSMTEAELIIGDITTWASKLNMIVISLALGITISLIPNISSSYAKKDFNDVSKKVNQALQALLFTTLPMAIGLSFLAGPVWTVFYGYDALSVDLFHFYVLQTISFSFYSVLIDVTQTMNNTKTALSLLITSFVIKIIFNVPMMHFCHIIGVPAYYGPTITTLLTQTLVILFVLYFLNKRYQVTYRSTIPVFFKTIFNLLIMIASLLILTLFIPLEPTSRMNGLFLTILYASIGVIIYVIVAFKSKLVYDVFGKTFVDQILRKFRFKKKEEMNDINL